MKLPPITVPPHLPILETTRFQANLQSIRAMGTAPQTTIGRNAHERNIDTVHPLRTHNTLSWGRTAAIEAARALNLGAQGMIQVHTPRMRSPMEILAAKVVYVITFLYGCLTS